MRFKFPLLVLSLFLSLASLRQQRNRIATWRALRRQMIQLNEQMSAATRSDMAKELALFFSASGGWQRVASASQTSRQTLQGRAILTWQKAFQALSLAMRYSANGGGWQLEKWQVQGLDTDGEQCQLELIIVRGEEL